MCPFVEKKRKKRCSTNALNKHLSTKKPPTLFFQHCPTPYYSNPCIINNYFNVQLLLLFQPLLLFGTQEYTTNMLQMLKIRASLYE